MIVTNAIDAFNQETIRDETLGSSDGSPLQQFRFLRGPLLDDEVVEVRERQQPHAEEIADLGADAVRKVEPENTAEQRGAGSGDKRVDSFFASGPRSRHYTLDYVTGVVAFGDGRRGIVPPEAKNSIVATSYRIGGGVARQRQRRTR